MAELPTFDVYRSQDGSVSKYIHEDGSETAVKLVKSTQNVLNPLTRAIEEHRSERNKYSVFISSSVGCYMCCPFCHLTLKDAKYHPLSGAAILSNLKEAIEDKLTFNPDLAQRYVKLSWMGMGDAVNQPEAVRQVSLEFLTWLLDKGYAKGVDGVDLSTVLPPVKPRWIAEFQALEAELERFPRNPVYAMDNLSYANGKYDHRNIFRLFYSVHSAIQACRDKVVPGGLPLQEAVDQLTTYAARGRYAVILHHILVDGFNDTEEELAALIELVNTRFPDNELRILRYNLCAKSPFHESDRFLAQIRQLSEQVNFLKVQVSPGSEVSAACGQFIVKDFIRGGQRKKLGLPDASSRSRL